jgi:uncharacterized protein (UPF0303 family)
MNDKTKYTPEEVLAHEKKYRFRKFDNQLALDIALKIIQYVKDHNLKSVRIQITFENEVVCYYLMQGKNKSNWLDRKTKTVLTTSHSSLYTFLMADKNPVYKEMIADEQYCIGGGGFPIFVNDELKGAICVSGLPHEDDHSLIIEVLKDIDAF